MRQRKDGSGYTAVFYILIAKQTSSFNDHAEAVRFQGVANRQSRPRPWRSGQPSAGADEGFTVASWCTYHIEHLTGVNEATRTRYRRYVANDIAPSANRAFAAHGPDQPRRGCG